MAYLERAAAAQALAAALQEMVVQAFADQHSETASRTVVSGTELECLELC